MGIPGLQCYEDVSRQMSIAETPTLTERIAAQHDEVERRLTELKEVQQALADNPGLADVLNKLTKLGCY